MGGEGEKKRRGVRGWLLRRPIMGWCILSAVSIYTIPDCLGFRGFSWSPTDNKMAYWVPGRDSIRAKITIIEIPSRKEESA